MVCQRVWVELLMLLNAMVRKPGESPGDWWAATDHTQARAEYAARRGRTLADDPPPLWAADTPGLERPPRRRHLSRRARWRNRPPSQPIPGRARPGPIVTTTTRPAAARRDQQAAIRGVAGAGRRTSPRRRREPQRASRRRPRRNHQLRRARRLCRLHRGIAADPIPRAEPYAGTVRPSCPAARSTVPASGSCSPVRDGRPPHRRASAAACQRRARFRRAQPLTPSYLVWPTSVW